MGLFTSKSESQTQVDPMRRDLTLDWQNRLAALSRRPQEFFPGQTYAEFQPEQEEALGMREQFARGMAGMVDPSMQAWQSMMSAPDVANNPYVQGMLEQQRNLIGRGLRESIPATESAAIAAGQFGGSRQGVVEALQERSAMETLASQAARTQMDAYMAGLGQQRYGMSAAPGLARFGMMPSDVLMGVGDVRRAEEQRGIDEAMARHQFEQEEPWRRLERYIGTYEPMSRPYTTKKTEEETKPSAFQIGTQLAGLGLAAFGGPLGMMAGSALMGSGMGGGGGGGASYGSAAAGGGGVPQSFMDPRREFNFRGGAFD